MKASLLTEGGIACGMGHLNRCAALASELSSRGIEVRIGLLGDRLAREFARDLGLATFPLESWDPGDVVASLDGDDIVVVDSYLASPESYREIRERVDHCLWIDDGGRIPYPRGVIVNSMPGSLRLLETSGSDPSCRILSGPMFHPLRPEFLAPGTRTVPETARSILCVLGGSDPTFTTPSVLAACRDAHPDAEIVAVVPRAEQRSDWASLLDDRMTLLPAISAREMRSAMDHADLAVVGGGQTLQEGLRTGLPMVAIEIASNQRPQMDAFLEQNAILDAGRPDSPSFQGRLRTCLEALVPAATRREISTRGPRIVDGLGCRRIVGELLGWTKELRLREARPADSREVWVVASEASTRERSLRPEPIAWESHESWFQQALAAPDLLFLVAEDPDGALAGYLRARREDSSATLSIALAPGLRGRGEGARLLREGCAQAKDRFPGIDLLMAWIESTNEPSMKSFRSAGFLETGRSERHGDRTFHLLSRSIPS